MKTTCVYLLLICLFAGWSFAQTESPVAKIAEVETLGSTEWQKTIEDSKNEIQQLLRDNDRLTAEYDLLKERLSALQANVLEVKQTLEENQRANQALEKFQQDQTSVREKVRRDIETVRSEIATIESEKAALVNQLSEEEKKTELWQNKLMELQVQKREQTLELKLQEISRQELEQGQDEEIERLKEELTKYQERERALDERLRSLQNQAKTILPETDKIISDNAALSVNVEQLKVQYQQQVRANEELAKKNEQLKQQAEVVPADLMNEKTALDAEVQGLETELGTVRKSIEASAQLLQQKRQIMNEIMRMDAENQDLRKSIEAAMK